MNNTVRSFIAFPVNPEIRQVIAQIQKQFKELDCNIKWVNPENIHLTLKFLGDVKLKKIDHVAEVLEDLCAGAKPVPVKLTQLGAFPAKENPRILWVGLTDDDQRIKNLVSDLEDKLGKIGFKKETKPFSPHITIGRTRSPKNFKLLTEALSNYPFPSDIGQMIDRAILYKSTLTSEGPIYEVLKEISL